MLDRRTMYLGTTAPIAFAVAFAGSALAGTFDDAPVLSVTGDGIIFSDPEEGVLPPGLKAVTTTPNMDFPNINSPKDMTNCLMSNNPDIDCVAERGSGKRIKTRLTGPKGMDISLSTRPSSGVTEYFFYGKTSNLSGARMTGLKLEFGTGTGSDFVIMDSSDPAVAALFDPDYNNRFNLPDGLFGNGGQEGTGIGFFDDQRAELNVTLGDPAILDAVDLTNAAHLAYFGDAILDDSMLPEAFFWDASGTALDSDEPLPIGWYNISQSQWLYGNLGVDSSPELDQKLQALADGLGVTVAELGYAGGGAIPEEIVALMVGDPLFAEGPIEDLRNVNLNYIIDLGDVDGNQVTLRISPTFSPIVEAAQSEQGFVMAAMLDAAANVPYFDLGNADEYGALIDEILGMSADDAAAQLKSIGFSYLPAFTNLGFEFSRNQISTITDTFARFEDGATVSTSGDAGTWKMGEDVNWLIGLEGVSAAYATTASSTGYDIDFAAISIGAERYVSPNFSYGLLIGGTNGKANAYGGLGEIDTTGISLAAFLRSRFAGTGLVQAVVGYQDLSYDSRRNVMGMTALGKTDGSQWFAAVKGEYLYQRGNLLFGPMASVEYYDLKVDAFDETGAGAWNLSVGEQTGSILLGSVGVRGEFRTQANTFLTGSLAYSVSDGDDMIVQSGFVGLPGGTFPVAGMDDKWVDLQLGFEHRLASTASREVVLAGGYRGALGDNYESHGLNLLVDISF